MDITNLPLLALLINLFVGVIVYVRGSKFAYARHFFILCVIFALWAFFDFLSITATEKQSAWWFGGVRTVASIAAISSLYHFTLKVTEHPLNKNRLYTIIIYLPTLITALLRFFTHTLVVDMKIMPYGYDIVPGQLYLFPVLLGFLMSVITVLVLVVKLRHEKDRVKISQYRYVLVGASIPLLTSIIIYTILPIWSINLKFLATILVSIIPIIIGFSIPRNQLLMPYSFFSGSIRSKIFSISVFSTFLIIMPAIFFIYNSSKANIYLQLEQQISLVLNQHKETSDNYFTSEFQSFTLLAKRPEFSELLQSSVSADNNIQKQTALDELKGIAQSFEQVNDIFLVDARGNTVISTVTEKQFPVAQFRQTSKSTFTTITRRDNELVYYLISPIYDDSNKTTIGYLISEFSATHFYEKLNALKGNLLVSTLYIINQANFLVSPLENYDESLVLTQKMPSTVETMCSTSESSILQSNVTTYKYESFTQDRVIGAATQLASMPWCLVLEVNEKQATQPLRSILLTSLVISLFSIVALTVISEWLGQLIGKPISALEAGTKIVSQGNYNYKVAVNTNDEIGSLSRAFDKMTASLKESRATITEQVKEQTKDLVQQKDALIRQQKQMVTILTELEDEKEKSDMLASDLEKFQRAVANASDHIVITDQDGYIIYANASVEKMTGFKPEEVLGQKVGSSQNWGGQMPIAFYKKLWRTIKINKHPFSGEITNKSKNGTIYKVFATITPIFNKEGDVQFYLGIERDITKEKEIDQAKTEFVSLASHQLRTPLSAINWYTEMLLDGDAGPLNEEQKSYLHEIYTGNQRMVDLVTSLLNVSRLELGTFTIEPVQLDLAELANSVIKELLPLIAKNNIHFEKKLEKIPLIKVDKKLTYIVIQNILSNALKYTPAGGRVSIEMARQAKNVVICVTDTGMGIPEDQQVHIFEKLFRASNAKESVTEGTGLGLYIVKSILDHTGGKISFTSHVGKGTTFIVKLPVKGMTYKEGSKKLELHD